MSCPGAKALRGGSESAREGSHTHTASERLYNTVMLQGLDRDGQLHLLVLSALLWRGGTGVRDCVSTAPFC